jgi:hypothetical protein
LTNLETYHDINNSENRNSLELFKRKVEGYLNRLVSIMPDQDSGRMLRDNRDGFTIELMLKKYSMNYDESS